MKNTLTTMMAGAATVAAVTVGSAFMAAPAEAAQFRFGNQLEITGGVTVARNEGDLFDFTFADTATNPRIEDTESGTSMPPFLVGDKVTFTNLTGIQEGVAFSLLTPFIAGIGLTADGSTLDREVDFFLTKGILSVSSDFRTYSFDLFGYFLDGEEEVGAFGELTTQLTSGLEVNSSSTRSFSTSVVVPTPAAVLPGLIGMGTAVFRKKKQEEEGDLALETAEAEA